MAGALATLFVVPPAHAPREIARRRAAATVVLFPTAASLAGWAFLQWRFSGSWTRSFALADPTLLHFPGGVGASLTRAAGAVVGDLVFAPVLVVAGTILFGRRPASCVAVLSFVACLVTDVWLGGALSPPTVVVLLSVVGLVLLPDRPSRAEQTVLWVAVVAQVAMAYAGLRYGLAPVEHWARHLATTLGHL